MTNSNDAPAFGIILTPDQIHHVATMAGYVKPAPAPPKPAESEVERMVRIANALPEEVWKPTRRRQPFQSPLNDSAIDSFRLMLIGAMAAYVASEPGGYVWNTDDDEWFISFGTDDDSEDDVIGDHPDALAECCKRIAERRAAK